METRYYQHYSVSAIVITIIFMLILFILSYIQFYFIFLSVAILLIIAFNLPIYYTIENDKIIVKRLFSKKELKFINFNRNSVNQPYTVTTMGVFGYLGYTMDGTISYTSNLMDTILIETNDKKYFISPLNVDLFLENLKSLNE